MSKLVEHWWGQKRSELSSLPLQHHLRTTPHFWCWQHVADTSYTEGRRRKVEKCKINVKK